MNNGFYDNIKMITSSRLTLAASGILKNGRTPILSTMSYDCMSLMGKNKGEEASRTNAIVSIGDRIMKSMA